MASDVTLVFFNLICVQLVARGLLIFAESEAEPYNVISKPIYVDDDYYFELIEPESIRYTYKLRPAKNFGVDLNTTYASVPLVPTDPSDGCTAILNEVFVRDAVALITRGGCSFVSKVVQAEAAGALLVIISDHDEDDVQHMVDMVQDETVRAVSIAAFFMLGKDGQMIRQAIQDHGLKGALINIPLNVTTIPVHRLNQPPWSYW